nr:arrestin domain-containing protein 4 [Danio rerio]|eukprot:XP_009300042.3 arrestin domain-containing protein 4 [Danio rerio]
MTFVTLISTTETGRANVISWNEKMPGSIKVLRLQYDQINESNTFNSGDIVEGRVLLEVTKNLTVDSLFVKFTGGAKVYWTEGESKYHDHERYFKLKQDLTPGRSGKERQIISPGRHVLPFKFQLPEQNLPPSFKEKVSGFNCWIRYALTAKLKRPFKSASTAYAELTFVPRSHVTNDHLLKPQNRTDKMKNTFSSGKISLTATTDKTGYMLGETIKVCVDIDNASSRDAKLKYSLKQQQMFIASRTTKRSKHIIQETSDCIPSGEKRRFLVNIKLPRDIMVSFENCRIIRVLYLLKVSLDVSFASDPAVKFPVVIIPPLQQCPPWQDPPPPYMPPQPVPHPGGAPPPFARLYDPVPPNPGAAAGLPGSPFGFVSTSL